MAVVAAGTHRAGGAPGTIPSPKSALTRVIFGEAPEARSLTVVFSRFYRRGAGAAEGSQVWPTGLCSEQPSQVASPRSQSALRGPCFKETHT